MEVANLAVRSPEASPDDEPNFLVGDWIAVLGDNAVMGLVSR